MTAQPSSQGSKIPGLLQLLPIPLLQSLHEKGFFHLLSANFLAQALAFSTSLLITKFLSPLDLGQAKILQSYIILFLVFAGSGFNATVLKYCAEDRTEQNKEYLLKFAFFRTLATTCAVMLLLFGLAYSGLLTGSPDLIRWIMIYALAIPFLVITDLLTVYLQASKKIREMSRVQASIKLINFVFIVACTWKWGLPGFVTGTLAASILGMIPPLSRVGWQFLKAAPEKIPVGIYSLALFSLLAYGITNLGQYGDLFVLDHFVTDRIAIGHYSLATYFVIAATQVTMTIQAVLIPYFSLHSNDRAWFTRNLRQNQLFTSLISLGIAAGVFLAAWILIRFFYGPAYQPALTYLQVLLIRYILFSSYAIISAALIGIGLIKYNFYAVGVTIPLGLFLSYLLQKQSGALGVAWGQVIAALLTLAIQLVLLQKARKIHFESARLSLPVQP